MPLSAKDLERASADQTLTKLRHFYVELRHFDFPKLNGVASQS
jgi:hypothetical protein